MDANRISKTELKKYESKEKAKVKKLLKKKKYQRKVAKRYKLNRISFWEDTRKNHNQITKYKDTFYLSNLTLSSENKQKLRAIKSFAYGITVKYHLDNPCIIIYKITPLNDNIYSFPLRKSTSLIFMGSKILNHFPVN